MNKKLIFSIILISGLILSAGSAYAQSAQPLMKFSAEVMFAESSTTIRVVHMEINRVSINMRKMVAVGQVIFEGDCSDLRTDGTGLYMDYMTDGGAADRVYAPYVKTGPKEYAFVMPEITLSQNDTMILYRIGAEDDDDHAGYFPEEDFQMAFLQPETSGTIGPSGGTVILQSGDQSRGDTFVRFLPNALLVEDTFSIKEWDMQRDPTLTMDSVQPLIVYFFTPNSYMLLDETMKPTVGLYYGSLPINANRIDVKYFDGMEWQKIAASNDINKRVATVNLVNTDMELGYFAVFDRQNLSDDDYRPEERGFTEGDTILFPNLEPGNSVTIYNLRNKEIKKITSPPFEWDGRTNTGGYAESGTYLYQISINGRVISGTLAFIR